MRPVLIIGTSGESHVPVGKINGTIKAVFENKALSSGVRNNNYNTNSADIDEVATTKSPKKGVSI